MDDDVEHFTTLIRAKLRRDGVKFWLPPFVNENGDGLDFPQDLIEKYAKETNATSGMVCKIFARLQSHALAKLKAKDLMKTSGIATLFLHIIITNSNEHTKKKSKHNEILQISLQCGAKDVQAKIWELIGITENNFSPDCRMIYKGKTLKSDASLSDQGVVNTSQIMVLLRSESCAEEGDSEKDVDDSMKETRNVAKALAKRKDGSSNSEGGFYLELNDQHGNKIHLPDSERQSLCFAMALHEKGRVLMRKKKFAECLWLFLEADAEFNNCRSEILNSVDNYALLSLDIVWSYFWLQQLDFLPDAEKRLGECKKCLSRTYGPNLERLTLCKGDNANEMILYVRLYLMEAICYFLRGKVGQCSSSLDQVEDLLKRLHVDDNQLTQMMSMGFTAKEGRLSLRACSGDITSAIDFISRRKEEHQQRKLREIKEKAMQKKARKYERTVGGNLVNIENLNALEQMGFDKKLALLALQHSDNDMEKSLEMLQEREGALYEALCREQHIPPSLVHQFTTMGFPRDRVEDLLRRFNCDVDKCLSELLQTQPQQSDLSETTDSSDSTVSSRSSDSSDKESDIDKRVESTLGELTEDLDDDHLDSTLVEETELLNKYRLLIAKEKQ